MSDKNMLVMTPDVGQYKARDLNMHNSSQRKSMPDTPPSNKGHGNQSENGRYMTHGEDEHLSAPNNQSSPYQTTGGNNHEQKNFTPPSDGPNDSYEPLEPSDEQPSSNVSQQRA